jgi:hypothetical protein
VDESEGFMTWREFASTKQLAWWMLWTDQGVRFLSWFLRKYWKQIMGTEAGSAAFEWIRSKVIEEQQLSVKANRIVIERFPDGYIKVYAEKCDVVFIHRLIVDSDEALKLEEHLAWINCPMRAKETYEGRCLATDFYNGRTIEQEANRQARMQLSASIGRKDSSTDRGNGKHRVGDNKS